MMKAREATVTRTEPTAALMKNLVIFASMFLSYHICGDVHEVLSPARGLKLRQ